MAKRLNRRRADRQEAPQSYRPAPGAGRRRKRPRGETATGFCPGGEAAMIEGES